MWLRRNDILTSFLQKKKKKRLFQLKKKCIAKRNMRSSTNARERGTLPPATWINTSPIIMQWGYAKTVRSISCKKKQQMGSITAPWIRVAIPTPSQSQRLIRYRKRLAWEVSRVYKNNPCLTRGKTRAMCLSFELIWLVEHLAPAFWNYHVV